MKRFPILLVFLFIAGVIGFIGCAGDGDGNTPSGPTIDPPTGLSAVAESFDRILVEWIYDKEDAAFKLEKTDSGEDGWRTHVELQKGARSFTDDTGVSEGKTYQYRVKADIDGKESDPCTSVSVTTPPKPPANLAITAFSSSSVSMSWSDISAVEDGYELQRKLTPSDENGYETIVTTEKDVNVYVDTEVEPNNSYDYRIRTTFGDLFSTWTDKASANTLSEPAGLEATVNSDSEIELSWTEIGTAYRLERKEIDANSWSTAAELAAGVTSYTDTDLNEATAYQYRLFALFADYVSDPSDVVMAVTIPTTPSSFSAVQDENTLTTINISWVDESTRETRYELQRRVGSEGDLQGYRSFNPNVESFSDVSLEANQSYYYRLSAIAEVIIDEDNTIEVRSPWSGIVSATTSVLTPSPPTDLTGEAIDYANVSLSWTDNADNEIGFVIERGLSRFGDYTSIDSLDVDAEVYIDEELDELTQYFYRIYAYNEYGNSDVSSVVAVTTPEGPPAPVEDFRVLQYDYREVFLAWTDAAHNEYGFVLERKLAADPEFRVLARLEADPTDGDTTYRDLEVDPLTTYQYRIYSYNQAGNSDYSEVLEVSTPIAPPSPPSNVRLAGTPTLVRIPITWDDNSDDEIGFIIKRRTVPSWNYAPLDSVLTDIQVYSDRYNLEGSTEYGYKVASYNESGESLSAELRVTTPPRPPLAPVNLTAEATSLTEVDLAWFFADFQDVIDFYEIERRDEPDGDFIYISEAEGIDNTYYHDTGLEPDEHTYWYRVRACNEGGDSPYSNIAVVTTPALEAPTNLGAKVADITAIQLDWDYPWEVGFQIASKDDEEGEFTFCGETDTTYYVDTGLEPDSIRYWYRVRAVVGEHESDWSNEASAATPFIIQLEDGFEEWDAGAEPGDPWVYQNSGSSFCEVTDTVAHDGDKSLHFVDPDPEEDATANIYVVTEPIPSGEFSFWLKATPGGYFGWRVMRLDENNNLFYEFLMQLNNDGSMLSNNGNQYAVPNGNWDNEDWFEVTCTWGDGAFSILFDDQVIVDNWGMVYGMPPNFFWFLTFSGVGAAMENAWVDEVLIQYTMPDDEERVGPVRRRDSGGLPGSDPFSTRAIIFNR